MDPNSVTFITLISISTICLFLFVFFLVRYTKNYNAGIKASQETVSDKDLLIYINEQPDKIVDSKIIARVFSIKKSSAAARLRTLNHNGVLSMLYNKTMTKGSYTLSRPIEKTYDLDLSNEPFMTLEDLLKIFKHYDYQVSLQELILATGLPMKVIKREMKYFEDEKIIKIMLKMENSYAYQRLYLLNEPYRSNPDAFLSLDNVNLDLKTIYEKVKKDFV